VKTDRRFHCRDEMYGEDPARLEAVCNDMSGKATA